MEPKDITPDELLTAVCHWLYSRARTTEVSLSLQDTQGAAVLRSAADALASAAPELRVIVACARRERS